MATARERAISTARQIHEQRVAAARKWHDIDIATATEQCRLVEESAAAQLADALAWVDRELPDSGRAVLDAHPEEG